MDILFEQTEINGMVLSNRFVRSATWAGLATDKGECTQGLIDLMAKLADGGVGLIITGHAYVHEYGQHAPWQLGIHKDELIPGLSDMTSTVHERGGKIAVQLGYGGAYLSKSRVRGMTIKDMQEVVRAFSRAAVRAKRAGFDAVQIFAAHGFFLSQLLCPRYNDRTDAYGGNIRNRARLLLEVLESIRNKVGDEYPVLVKLNAHDIVEDGLTLEDSIQVGIMLEEGGIDAIELSGGLLNLPNLLKERIGAKKDEVYFRDEARAFKEKTKVPVVLVGGIRSYNRAKQLVEEGTADYISMCRPFICEPDLVNRWEKGDLRKAECISCNNCVEQVKKGEGISCVPSEKEPAETFFPEMTEHVPASPPHPSGTSYNISVGLEQWESSFIPVVKVEMAYNGEVSGRCPSFPLGTEDHDTVYKAITDLIERHSVIHAKK